MTKKIDAPFLGMTGKDWITVPLAVLALVISAGSAYYSIIQKIEHVSVIARYAPVVRKDGETLTPLREEYFLIFVNSGNRPVSIVGLSLLFAQHKDRQTTNCYPESLAAAAGRFETDVEPFVIKENEVVIKKFKLGVRHPFGMLRAEGPDASTFPIIDELKGQKNIPVEVCLAVELATPSLKYHSPRVSIFRYDVTDQGTYLGDDLASEYRNAPSVLIDRKITIFGR